MTTPDLVITFLGRVPKQDGVYRTTAYDFGDPEPGRPVAFFGWALRKRLRPRRILILGTAGSMWDHLFTKDIDLGEQEEDLCCELMESVETQSVSQAQLDALAPSLAERLGCEIDLAIIPYCRDQAEQTELLGLLAARVGEGEHVHLDVTHGFRHLPMLALLAALHLRLARGAVVEDVWYGSFDPDTRSAPVYRLGGLLRIADWLQALASFDKDGDYGVFAPLLVDDGLPADKSEALTRASHAETTLNFGQARERLHTALKAIDGIDGLSALYAPLLRERIAWIREQDDAARLARLTRAALERGDMMRVAILLPRAFLERLKRPGESTVDYDMLTTIEGEFRAGKRGFVALKKPYEEAKKLRNSLAHGSRPKGNDTRRTLASPDALQARLSALVRTLLS